MPLFNTTLFNSALFGGPVAGPGIQPRQVGNGLLYPALRKAGVTLAPGRTPSTAQFQDAIDELNRLTGSLNCDRLFIYSITGADYPLTAGQTSYTIGLPADSSDVDFLAERPQMIESASIATGPDSGRPLGILTDPEWARRSANLVAGGIADAVYNDRAYPVSTLFLTGSPQAGEVLRLCTWTQVPYFVTISDEVLLPRQYEDVLVLNLAVRLAPHFQRPVDSNVREDARIALMRLESINAPQPIADTSGALTCGCGGYDIYTDQ